MKASINRMSGAVDFSNVWMFARGHLIKMDDAPEPRRERVRVAVLVHDLSFQPPARSARPYRGKARPPSARSRRALTDRGHVAVALVADLAAGVFEDDRRGPSGRSWRTVRLEHDGSIQCRTLNSGYCRHSLVALWHMAYTSSKTARVPEPGAPVTNNGNNS